MDKFSKACRARVNKFSKTISEQSARLGQWMDWDNSYYTMDDYNIEHIWHFLKVCHEKGWLYEGTNSMPWCYRCGTSLSQHELADSYKELTHKSVYVSLPIKNKKNEYLLIWTTTPWTLPANVAVAVNPSLDYVLARVKDKKYYVSPKVVEKLGEHKILKTIKGKELVGLEYQGPFDELGVQKDVKHPVIKWTDVSDEEGTGLVHIAPGCGAEDFKLGKENGLAQIEPIDEAGVYVDGFGELTGNHVKKVTDAITDSLEEKKFLFKSENHKHRYPSCWRCKEELVFRIEKEWFISSNEIRPLMKKASKKVEWYPDHAGKLMQDWLDNMGDWCISRKRFWGLPLPIWECSCGNKEIIGSVDELKKKAVSGIENLKELHRPWIDDVIIKCPSCKGMATRIKDVGDCWLDAGIVPFSTLNYLNDKRYWKKWFPAEFITEMREQIRLWFYSMLFMAVTLEDQPPYQKALVYEKVHDEKGEPMHKSAGNAIWFDDAVEKMGADVMRWLYTEQNPSSNVSFGYTPAKEVSKKIKVIWNLANYVQGYCKKDGTVFDSSPEAKWVLSRLESTKKEVTECLEKMQPHKVINSIHNFLVEDVSRTYGQFIRDALDQSKVQNTLRKCFKEGLLLLAPICPFFTEKIYQELFKSESSIFLEDWPKVSASKINPKLEEQMETALEVIQEILAQRENAKIGVRWPLAKVSITGSKVDLDAIQVFSKVIQSQTNIKKIESKTSKKGFVIKLDTSLTKSLEAEGYARELTRGIQSLRKKSGLNKEDKIELYIVSRFKDIEKFKDDLKSKVSAKKIYFELKNFKDKSNEKIKDHVFSIGIKKV